MRGLEDFRGCRAQLAMLRNFGLIPRMNSGACTLAAFGQGLVNSLHNK